MNTPLVLLGFLHTSPLEIASFALAVTMVLLNIRQSPWAWLFSIASAALYAIVFFQARIYGDMALQFFFIAVSLWGWYQWLFGGRGPRGVNVTRLTPRGMIHTGGAWLVTWLAVAALLTTLTDTDVPRIDAFLTAGSLVGQFLLSRKKLENWHLWIVIDLIYIGLYIHKDLYLTAVLYALFVAMAIVGLLTWKKSLAETDATVVTVNASPQ
jgi:nicotinamide mononucleotide transporter